jgi:hypothetical protein
MWTPGLLLIGVAALVYALARRDRPEPTDGWRLPRYLRRRKR